MIRLAIVNNNRKTILGTHNALRNCRTLSTLNEEGQRKISSIIPTRSEQVARLSSEKEFDVLIVGGGATGSGAAVDAASRGLSTAMIERGDFGTETSARSTKLLWVSKSSMEM